MDIDMDTYLSFDDAKLKTRIHKTHYKWLVNRCKSLGINQVLWNQAVVMGKNTLARQFGNAGK